MPLPSDLKKYGKVRGDHINASTSAAYTVATLPTASADNRGRVVYVSNGAAGQPCLAFSTGSAWVRLAVGAAVNVST